MKIRTPEQLFDLMSQELSWRRKELHSLRSQASISSLSPDTKNALLRSTVALTYAHWEGYIKACATAYIEYVAMQRLLHNELSPNFLALSIRPILMKAFHSKKAVDHQNVVNFFMTQLPKQSSIHFEGTIETQSNLSSVVFRNIIETLGFDYSLYETKEKLLDERLLKSRNKIAHGKEVLLTEVEVFELLDECLAMMENFRTQIDNAVALNLFKAVKAT